MVRTVPPPLKQTEFNQWLLYMQGFTPEGVFRSPYKYLLDYDGTDYYASNAFQVVYGGPDDAGGVDGADSDAVIAATLANLTTGRTWKEKVVLKGNFEVDDSINIPSNTILEILGKVKAKDNCSILPGCAVLQNSGHYPSQTPNTNIEIIGGEIDGNKANNAVDYEGIFLSVVNNFQIRDTIVHDSPEVGIVCYPSSTRGLSNGEILNCESYNNEADGLQLEMAIANARGAQIKIIGGRYHDNDAAGVNLKCHTVWAEPPLLQATVQNVEADHNAGYGIAAIYVGQELKKISVLGCHAHENGLNGIWLQSVIHGLISGNTAEKNGYSGIETFASKHITISSNIAINNHQVIGGYLNNESGIAIHFCDHIIVSDNHCTDTQDVKTQTHGITLGTLTSQEYFDIHDNDLIGNINPYDQSGTFTNLKIHNNLGYVTESCGASTGTGAQQDITHNLSGGYIPNNVSVVPTETGATVSNVYADGTWIHCTVTSGKAYRWSASVTFE